MRIEVRLDFLFRNRHSRIGGNLEEQGEPFASGFPLSLE